MQCKFRVKGTESRVQKKEDNGELENKEQRIKTRHRSQDYAFQHFGILAID